LHVAGVERVIRLGTAGAMVPELRSGDIVIADAAVRDDGVTQQLLPPEYPASATPELVCALIEGARIAEVPARRGLVWTRASFYPGLLPLPTVALVAAGVIAIEMELSALLVHGAARGYERAGILVIDGISADDAPYDPHKPEVAEGIDRATAIALTVLIA
jgi:uridine phosphorylase